jgi:LysM repeat protein
MKMPKLLTRKKRLSASTARRSRSLGLPDEMDYEEMSEPNMKLSRALLIVLVLHVVAVAGIVAFNTIKTRETLAQPTPAATPAAIVPDLTPASNNTTAAAADQTASNELPKAPATAAPKAVAAPSAVPVATGVKDSGKIYTVVRGDNPVTIARRLKISEADLLELNQITDPRKLQINQKLKIPEARTVNHSKHSSD